MRTERMRKRRRRRGNRETMTSEAEMDTRTEMEPRVGSSGPARDATNAPDNHPRHCHRLSEHQQPLKQPARPSAVNRCTRHPEKRPQAVSILAHMNTRTNLCKLTHLIICLLTILQLSSQLSLAHSNIHSVWQSKDDNNHQELPKSVKLEQPTQSEQQQRANSNHQQPDQTRRLYERSGDSWLAGGLSKLLASSGPLQASSSSLQPAIAAPVDNDDDVSERRYDPPRLAYNGSASDYGLTRAGNGGSNGASSLDHLWSLNQTNNAQVQFDEEHLGIGIGSGLQQQPQSKGSMSVASMAAGSSAPASASSAAKVQSSTITNRRQDLNETSKLAPQQDATNNSNNNNEANLGSQDLSQPSEPDQPFSDRNSQQQTPSGKSSQQQQQMNYFMGNLENNQELIALNGSREPEGDNSNGNNDRASNTSSSSSQSSPSFIYYLPDGNRWNPANTSGQQSSAELSGSSGRRKLHNSGTQYDFRELERVLKHNAAMATAASYAAQQPARPLPVPSYYEPMNLRLSGGGSLRRVSGKNHETRTGVGGADDGYLLENHRNYPSYYYLGGGDQVHFADQRQDSSRPLVVNSGPGGHLWKQPSQNLHYGFQPTTSSTESTPQQPTMRPQATYAATPYPTTTTYSPTLYTSSRPSSALSDYRRLNQNSHIINHQRLSPSALNSRFVTHPTRRPLRFEQRPGELFVDQRRDPADAWRLRGQHNSAQSHRPTLVIGQRPSFLPNSHPNSHHNLNSAIGRAHHHHGISKSGHLDKAASKPRKSLLGSLGSKINSWVDPTAAREQKLQETFYGTGNHKPRRRTKPPSYWKAANTIYYIDAPQAAIASVLNPETQSLVDSSSYLSHASPSLAHLYPTGHRLSSVADQSRLLRGAALNYYPSLYGSQAYHQQLPSLAIRQPTVAPAPSSLDKFYSSSLTDSLHHPHLHPQPYHHLYTGRYRPQAKFQTDSHLTQSSHHQSQYVPQTGSGRFHGHSVGGQQPASFIPVVAVSTMTKTSPAPRPMQQLDDGLVGLDPNSDLSSELIDYLEMKTGDVPASNYGNRNNNRNRLHSREVSRPAPQPSYRDQVSSGNNHSDINLVRAQLDEYGNYASGSMNRDTAFQRIQPLSSGDHGQRNSYASKPLNSGVGPNEHTTTVKSAVFGYVPHEPIKPLLPNINMPSYNSQMLPTDTVYTDQLSEHHPVHSQYHYPRANHLDSNDLMALDEPPSLGLQLQANNFAQNDIAHPFISSDPSSVSGARKTFAPSSSLQPILSHSSLAAAATRLRPASSLPTQPIEVYPTSQHQYHGFQFLQPAESGFVSPQHLNPLLSSATDGQQQQPTILTAAATEINPLLPVMFAASPAYAIHPGTSNELADQQQSASGDGEDGEGSDESSSPANKGKKRSSDFFASAGQLLLSALPLLLAPTLGLMFASSPLPVARYHAPNTFTGSGSMHSSIPGEYLNSLNMGHVSNASPVPQLFTPSPPGYNMTSTSRPKPSSQRYGSASSNSALSAKNRTTPTPQKLTVTLTTLGPPVFVNETELPEEHETPPKVQTIDHHHHHHHVNNAILLLSDEDPEHTLDTLNTTDYKTNLTEASGGYEGADYDAQFANLKKYGHPNHRLHQQVSNDNSSHVAANYSQSRPTNSGPDKAASVNRHQHQNHEINQVSRRPTRPQQSQAQEADEDVSTKLYPVSTWPTMRRKTVSLVTSNGNKTLLDASEKYPTIDYYTSQQQQANSETGSGSKNSHVNYTTTFDDSLDEPEMVGYNSSRVMTVRKEPNSGSDSAGDDSKMKHDALEFMFSDGLSTVSLTREPFASRLAKANANNSNRTRSKREVGLQEETPIAEQARDISTTYVNIGGRPVRVVRRAIRIRPDQHPINNNLTDANNNNNGTSSPLLESASLRDVVSVPEETSSINGLEPMKIDGSQSKSAHIVATMIARLEDEEEAAAAAARHQQVGPSDEYHNHNQPPPEPGRFAGSSDADELKELLLRKKALLARMANNQTRIHRHQEPSSPFPPPPFGPQRDETGRSRKGDEPSSAYRGEQDGFSAGGRGRIPPIEVAPIIKIKLYGNSTRDRARRLNRPLHPSRTSNLEVSDETKKALANFGNLMMKDSVRNQQEQPQHEHDSHEPARMSPNFKRQDSERPTRRWRQEAASRGSNVWDEGRVRGQSDNYEAPIGGSATERSVSRSTGWTDGVAFNPEDGMWTLRGDSGDQSRREIRSKLQHRLFGFGNDSDRRQYQPPVNHREDDYYYHYNDDNRPPTMANHRSLTHQQLQLRDRVNLLDGDSASPSFFGSADDKSSDDYHNGHGYMGQPPPPLSPSNRFRFEVDRTSSNNSGDHYSPYSPNYLQEPNKPGDDRPQSSLRPSANYSNHNSQDPRRGEPSSPGGVQFGSMHDSSLHQPHGYAYDMRNYPPDPLPGYATTPPPPLSDLQSYHSPPYNATTYAPHLYPSPLSAHLNPHKPHYQPAQFNPQDDQQHNYPSPNVPNGYNRPPDYYSPGQQSTSAHFQPSNMDHLQQHNQHQNHHKYHGPAPALPDPIRYPASSDNYQREMYSTPNRYPAQQRNFQMSSSPGSPYTHQPSASLMQHGAPLAMSSSQDRDSRSVSDYLKQVQFSDTDRDKLMASYLTCDGLLNDNDHCLERLSCEFSDPQNIEKANKLDRAVSSILLGHILINTHIPNQFKLRLKSASLFGYTQSGKCSRFVCSKLSRPNSALKDTRNEI